MSRHTGHGHSATRAACRQGTLRLHGRHPRNPAGRPGALAAVCIVHCRYEEHVCGAGVFGADGAVQEAIHELFMGGGARRERKMLLRQQEITPPTACRGLAGEVARTRCASWCPAARLPAAASPFDMRCRLGRDSGRASNRACAHFRTARQETGHGRAAWVGHAGEGRECTRFGQARLHTRRALLGRSLKAAARWGGSLMPEPGGEGRFTPAVPRPHRPTWCPALPCQPRSPPQAHRPLRAQLVHVDLEVYRAGP